MTENTLTRKTEERGELLPKARHVRIRNAKKTYVEGKCDRVWNMKK